MTEYEVKGKEEIVSWFIVSTCQLLPKSFSFSAVSDHLHDLMLSNDPIPTVYEILCGSQAEFYIRPLNTCITDKDCFIANSNELAFIGDFPVLPSDMSGLPDTIQCFKIESYDGYPGFVRVRRFGKMNYDWKHRKFEYNHVALLNGYIYMSLDLANCASECFDPLKGSKTFRNTVSGPSLKFNPLRDGYWAVDTVPSKWCPQWPTEARDWPKRPRYNGWPTTDTISEVQQNGCHVVYVRHRSCSDDKLQWRLSFSFAEVILLQSWTRVQQIVYHLLRYFAKTEIIQRDCPKEDEILCPYHLKTLMLWTCEERSFEWWNSSSVITICCELLKKLSECLKRRYCPNYFIPEANLFHDQWNPKMCEKSQMQLDKFCNSDVLCHWFVENYILSYIRTHLGKNPFEVIPDFQNYILPLIDSWKTSELESLDSMFYLKFKDCNGTIRSLMENKACAGMRLHLKYANSFKNHDEVHENMSHLPTVENVLCHTYHNNVQCILHTAYSLDCGEISWNSSLFVEFVIGILTQPKILRSQYHNFPKIYTNQCRPNWFYFLRAQDLMQNLTGSNSRSEFQLLALMSKEDLRKALSESSRSGFSNCKCIVPAALAYLAALHFATTEYQQAIRFCSEILVKQTSQEDKETLNVGCLFFIDDIAKIVGMFVLHKKIIGNNLHYIGRRLYLDLRLSPEVFAHYLTVLSAERVSKHLDVDHDLPDSAFPMDEYLKALLRPKCTVSIKSVFTHFHAVRQIVYRRTDSLTETQTTSVNQTVIEILMAYALENTTSFYSVILKDFHIQCNTVDCYRALYLYKCRQYNEVLHLCEQILHEPDLQSDLKEFAFANVLLLPPLDSFFDGDVQSLLGFHTLVYYLSPPNDDMPNLTDKPTFAQFFYHYVCSNEKKLFASLREHYSVKCNYFLGRHFLARYLKVRCCIDCNHPLTEALTEFAAMKSKLSFEYIIRRFLLQKLRIIKN